MADAGTYEFKVTFTIEVPWGDDPGAEVPDLELARSCLASALQEAMIEMQRRGLPTSAGPVWSADKAP